MTPEHLVADGVFGGCHIPECPNYLRATESGRLVAVQSDRASPHDTLINDRTRRGTRRPPGTIQTGASHLPLDRQSRHLRTRVPSARVV